MNTHEQFKLTLNVGTRSVKMHVRDFVKTNSNLIDMIDHQYFFDIEELKNTSYKDNNFIYYSLFQNYFHALETLFSLIGSILQAPYFYYGWLLSYSNKDLYWLVESINNGDSIKNAHKLKEVTWCEISKIIHPQVEGQEVIESRECFEKVLKHLASIYLSEEFQNIYNSIKHGFRAKKNAIKEITIDKCKFMGSDYGFEYGYIDSIANEKYIKYKITNIDPNIIYPTFEFVGTALFNIKNFLRIVNQKSEINVQQYLLKKENIECLLLKVQPSLRTVTFNDPLSSIGNGNLTTAST